MSVLATSSEKESFYHFIVGHPAQGSTHHLVLGPTGSGAWIPDPAIYFSQFLTTTCDKTQKVQADGGAIPPGMTKEDVWNAKYIYDSAYHPTTGELVFMPGRMSFQGKFFEINRVHFREDQNE